MLQLAALLFVILGVAHSWLGERYLLQRLFRRSDQLPKLLGSTDFTKNTLRFVWHLTTLLGLGFALLLLQLAEHASAAATATIIGGVAIGGALLALVFTRGRHLSWILFLAAGALCLAWAAMTHLPTTQV